MAREIWKLITDFPDYEISSHGRVRRLTTRGKGRTGQFITPQLVEGNLIISLSRNGSVRSQPLALLVALAFIKAPYQIRIVGHKNGDKLNVRKDNLFWRPPFLPPSRRYKGPKYAKVQWDTISIKYVLREAANSQLSPEKTLELV